MYTLTININTSLGTFPTEQAAEEFVELLDLKDYEICEVKEQQAA